MMADYDFSTLNDKDFEILVVDLLSRDFNTRVERFKSGKDGGVDGRFFCEDGGEVVIQCKHWIKSGITKLIDSLEKVELPKVNKLNPKKYYLVTSLELSRANKINIQNIFSKYMGNESYIYGKEDLNNLLRKYPEVEKINYKLWFLSTGVLENIINADVLGRSKYKLEEIKELNKLFVQTKNYEDAIHHLERLNSIIISGQPGIGKTTLADQLCMFYLGKGFEFYLIEDSVSEVERVYKDDKKQVFLFDDFLGSNFLEAIQGKEDSKIVSFIARVKRDKNKRFILTSRTNILNQGRNLSMQFEVAKINKNEFELHLCNYTEFDKAKILYNHIYFSDLEEQYIEQFYMDKRYRLIINHKNFNPRLISFLTDDQRVDKSISSEKYWDYFFQSMNSPEDIWGNVFDRQLTGIYIDVVVAVTLNQSRIDEEKLLSFFNVLNFEKYKGDAKLDFSIVMRTLVGSLLNRSSNYGRVEYTLFNPSIADYIYSRFLKNESYLEQLIILLQSCNAVVNLLKIAKENMINEDVVERVANNLIKFNVEKDEFILSCNSLRIFSEMLYKVKFSMFFINYLKGKDSYFLSLDASETLTEHINLIIYIIESNLWSLSESENLEILNKYSDHIVSMDYDELVSFGRLLTILDVATKENIYKTLKVAIVSLCENNIHSWVTESDTFNHVVEESQYDESDLIRYVDEILSEFHIEFDEYDYGDVYASVDMDAIISANQTAYADDKREEEYSGFRQREFEGFISIDPIEDLFDRG